MPVPGMTPPEQKDKLIDPISEQPKFKLTESRVAISGHPIHAMSVAFPIALTSCAFGADVFYWYTGDPFWARAAYWALGTGFLFGNIAAFSGAAELLLVPGIRAHAASWTHAVIAVMLLALLGANWGYRFSGYEAAVLPYGIVLSGFCLLVVVLAAWHGGKLVFDYHIGTQSGS
jgi:uncharacterized membrane protein